MNQVAMFNEQTASANSSQNNSNTKTLDSNSSIFQGLLMAEQVNIAITTNNTSLNEDQVQFIDSDAGNELLATLEALINKLFQAQNSDEVNGTIPALAELKKILAKENIDIMDLKEVENQIIQLILAQDHLTKNTESLIDLSTSVHFMQDVKLDKLSEVNIQKQFSALMTKFETLLNQLSNEQDVTKTAPKVLGLLEQWIALEQKFGKNGLSTLDLIQDKDTKEHYVWKELINAFQKRNQLVTRQQYSSNAKVTGTDIAKWMHNALTNHPQNEFVVVSNLNSSQVTPMSKVEQYVLYINQTQSPQSVDQELMKQFQQVIKTSNFLKLNNGTSHMSIALRPENLGEMMVKLTQINGEMVVKIIVSSHAAKEMLESNIHQLKNMFSPNQVVIEREVLNTEQEQEVQKEKDEQQFQDKDQSGSQHSSKDDEQQSENDFESTFRELIMNEKV